MIEEIIKEIVPLLNLKYVLIYFVILNLVGYLSMVIDKYKAKKNLWRIPEGTLILIALFGGSIGSLIGMYHVRHKTKKMKFTIGIPTILITEICILVYVLVVYFI